MTEPLTEEERQAIRAEHVEYAVPYHAAFTGERASICSRCEEPWPCRSIRLLDLLEQAEQDNGASWRELFVDESARCASLAERLEQSEARAAMLEKSMKFAAEWLDRGFYPDSIAVGLRAALECRVDSGTEEPRGVCGGSWCSETRPHDHHGPGITLDSGTEEP